MTELDLFVQQDSIKEAYKQAREKLDKLIEKKYEFIRSVFAEDLSKMDPKKAQSRILRANNEQDLILTLIAYLEIFDSMIEVYEAKAKYSQADAKIWNAAYQASISENLEFTKLMLLRNAKVL
jgi:hypothetical protein